MEDTRRAIRTGRRLADEGLYAAATETWKAALSGAYNLQDYAGMFVLSSNLGEVCVQIATQSTDYAQVTGLLQEATQHLDYALQVVDQCSLREVMGGYRALYRSVRCVETTKRKAEKLMEKMQKKEEVMKCRTCGGTGDVVLDENDGCYYCRACYDEFYGTVQAKVDVVDGDEEIDEGEDELVGVESKMDVGDLDVLEGKMKEDADAGDLDALVREREQDVELRHDDEDVPASDPTSEQVEVVTDEKVQDRIEETKPDRLRYERVELGSLADFLAGKVHVDKKEQIEIQQIDIARDTLVPSTAEADHTDNTANDSVEDVNAPNEVVNESVLEVPEPSTPSSDAEDTTRAEEVVLDEYSAEATDRHEYSISELLELRQLSPSDCPKALLASPVLDDGTAPTPARTKPNNSRKKTKKTARSAASHRQDKTDADPEEADGTRSISLLPTLNMVDTMRKALDERRQTDTTETSGLFDWPNSLLPMFAS